MSNRKDNLIRVRVSSTQQKRIYKAAAAQNKTTSQYVRDRTLNPPSKGLLASLFSRKK
jgi:uncharacterized protein (DUF1778 family)